MNGSFRHLHQPDSVTPGTPGDAEHYSVLRKHLWPSGHGGCYSRRYCREPNGSCEEKPRALPANFSAKQPSTAVVFLCLAGWQASWQAAAPLKFSISVNFCNASCKRKIRHLFNVTDRYSFPLIQYCKNRLFLHITEVSIILQTA